jgi:hypothetical protein
MSGFPKTTCESPGSAKVAFLGTIWGSIPCCRRFNIVGKRSVRVLSHGIVLAQPSGSGRPQPCLVSSCRMFHVCDTRLLGLALNGARWGGSMQLWKDYPVFGLGIMWFFSWVSFFIGVRALRPGAVCVGYHVVLSWVSILPLPCALTECGVVWGLSSRLGFRAYLVGVSSLTG